MRIEQRRKAGTESWLARIFLLAVIGAGFLTHYLGLKPGDLELLPCPIHYVTGIECPGCGMTRASIALARGEIGSALHFNPFSVGLVLLAGGFALFPNAIRRHWSRLSKRTRTVIPASILVLVFAVWLWRTVL
ncbi:MAG: DUF2752 domain-containing protein [Acidobacteriota bacterium]